MANLRANKITSTEVFETTGSVQFDGTGDYLEIPNSSDLEFGNNSFTIEAWLYPVASGGSIFNIFYNKGVSLQCYWKSNTNKIEVYADSNNTNNYDILNSLNTPSGSIISGQWAHIAIVRNINVFQIYLNGIASGSSITNSASMGSNSNGVTIGDYKPDLSNYEFNGHISNLRVLKGTALYTKNFTPPTRELTVIPNTVLLACTSTTNTAQEATGKTITVNGNAVANELTPGLLTDVVKSGGTSAITGSVEFDGTGDYLSIPSSSDFAFGTGDFTVECWIYEQNRSPSSYTSLFQTDGSNSGGFGLVISPGSGGTLGIYVWGFIVTSTSSVPTNGWVHIAATRNSGTTRLFINGVLNGSSATSYTPTFNDIRIGLNPSSGAEKYNGFISNLRVLKGTALYTGSFIPPSRELKKIPNTVLLCCKNSNDPTAEETGKTITANGDPAASNFTPQIGSDGSVTFDGVTKINTQNYFYLPTGNTENRGRGRGVFGGGGITNANVIEYIQIQSTGTAIDFGDLSANKLAAAACSSSTRGVLGGGYIQPSQQEATNVIEFITISSTGNAVDFGDLSGVNHSRRFLSSCSNTTRGIFAGGVSSQPANNTIVNSISYVTIASIGDAIDFGDLTGARAAFAACSSSTRGVFGGGNAPTATNVIEYITITSTGNAQDFGDLIGVRTSVSACSSSTRGIFAGGYSSFPSSVNIIEFITIASTGDTTDFGDLSGVRRDFASSSNSTRAVFGGGYTPPSVLYNILELITISSTGNAQDFGDLNDAKYSPSACSDSHGGLG